MPTKIEWAEETWNPITGCTKISEGCRNCYAERMAKRMAGRYGYPKDEPFRPGTFHPGKIDINLFSPGKRVFVCSMGDFFHEAVTREMKQDVYNVIDDHPETTFIFLTKRPHNVMSWWIGERQNVWLGVTAENQEQADKRIPILLQIPAAVRFVSVEPMLGPVLLDNGESSWFTCNGKKQDGHCCESHDVFGHHFHGIDLVICGGESGPKARPVHPDWVRSLRDQCQAAGVPFFFKQWGEWIKDDFSTVLSSGRSPKRCFLTIDGNVFDSFPAYQKSISMMRIGKKSAGRLLDGRTWGVI